MRDGVRALLWTDAAAGPASGVIDLTPPGLEANLEDVRNGQQVGYVHPRNSLQAHAGIWNGTAESFVDLHPVGAYNSFALGTTGAMQAGYVMLTASGPDRATAWFGTAAGALDLHQYVTGGYSNSIATDVDENGVILGIVFNEIEDNRAVMWVPVPEPTAAAATLLLPALFLRRRR